MITITIPYPPSGNHMWKHTRQGRHYLTAEAKAYYDLVREAVITQGKVVNIDQPVEVTCVLYPPDNRRRDMDNAWKVISDALTKASLWQDDHLIKSLHIEWQVPVKSGKAFVSVGPFFDNRLTS